MDNDIIVLTTNDGEDIEFVEIARINLDCGCYVILQPVKLLEGMEEDEALVFSVVEEDGNDSYNIELDEEINDRVFEEYYRLLDLEDNK